MVDSCACSSFSKVKKNAFRLSPCRTADIVHLHFRQRGEKGIALDTPFVQACRQSKGMFAIGAA